MNEKPYANNLFGLSKQGSARRTKSHESREISGKEIKENPAISRLTEHKTATIKQTPAQQMEKQKAIMAKKSSFVLLQMLDINQQIRL